MRRTNLEKYAMRGMQTLREDDPMLCHLLEQEYERQNSVLAMVAASSVADPSVLVCEGTVTSNVTTEGYPGERFHAGCEVVDKIEQLAIDRAKSVFRAQFANVQPHSGSSANEIVMFMLLRPGDTILGLDLDCGGHLTHGSKASISGQYFRSFGYRLTPEGLIDYDQVRDLALQHSPRLIFCGASSYPRAVDFQRFRMIADEAGAYLLADISHIAGLVAAGVHASPIDHAHFTTTSTYKQLYGPRGGLILMGEDHNQPAPDGKRTLSDLVQKAVFPFFQGTPSLSAIAAKARALAMVATPGFKLMCGDIITCAQALATGFMEKGYRVLTGGTDNHMVVIDVAGRGLTGVIAERALEECNLVINKNVIPGDRRPPTIASGIRLGTNTLALRGMRSEEMHRCVDLIHRVLSAIEPRGADKYLLDPVVRSEVRETIAQLCKEFPLPNYPMTRSVNRDEFLKSEVGFQVAGESAQ